MRRFMNVNATQIYKSIRNDLLVKQTHTSIHIQTYIHTHTHTHAHTHTHTYTHTNTNTYKPHINLTQRVHGALKNQCPIFLSDTVPPQPVDPEHVDISVSPHQPSSETNGPYVPATSPATYTRPTTRPVPSCASAQVPRRSSRVRKPPSRFDVYRRF